MRQKIRTTCVVASFLIILTGCADSFDSMPTGSTNTQGATKPGVITIPVEDRVSIGPLSGTTLTGTKYVLARNSKLTVINVWASWCTNCRLEWKDLQLAAAKYPEVRFLGLNTSDKQSSALAFVQKYGDNYPHIFDPDLFTFGSMRGVNSAALPMTVILDNEQKVAAKILGKVNFAELSDVLDNLKASK